MSARVIVLFVLSALSGIAAADAQQPQSTDGDAARGKVLYSEVGCYACHGLVGQGAQATGPRLARTQLPFVAFLALVRHPLNQMPPYEAPVLPEQDAADIFAYVVKLPAAPDPNSIVLLKANR